jgi:DNA polymerase-3 subunit alpha
MAHAGVFDAFEPDRARAAASVEPVLAMANKLRDDADSGQSELFGGPRALRIDAGEVKPWTHAEKLQKEYESIGFFVSGHPLDDYAPLLKRFNVRSWSSFVAEVRRGQSVARLAAVVLSRTEKRTRTGGKLGVLNLSDQTGQFEAVIFSETLNAARDLLEPGRAVMLLVQGAVEGDDVRARVQEVKPLDGLSAAGPVSVRIFLRDEEALPAIAERLGERGEDEIAIVAMVEGGQREVEIKLPGRFKATPRSIGAFRALRGVVAVEFA